MTPEQLSALEQSLDKVPTHLLREALSRRRSQTLGFKTPLDDLKKAQYKIALQMICDRHQLHPEALLSNRKIEQLVHARWALYRRLTELGFSIMEIAAATGHERTRVHHGLKNSAPA